MHQKVYNALKTFEARLRSKLVDADRTVLDCFTIWTVLICDVVVDQLDEQRVGPFLRDWEHVTAVRSLFEILEFVDMLDSCLIKNNHSYKAFKTAIQDHLLNKTSDTLIWDVFLRHFSILVTRWFCRREVQAFKALHQIFAFPLRVTVNDDTLEKKAATDYRQTIVRVRELSLTVGEELNEILTRWFPREWEPCTAQTFAPCYGPGITSTTSRRAYEKDRQLSVLSPLADYYVRSRSLTEWFPSYSFYVQHVAAEHSYERFAYRPEVRSDLSTRIIFVPKNWKKKRTISAEPASLLYLQQGIKAAMLNFVHRPSTFERRTIRRSTGQTQHPLRKRYDPADQSPNRELAWEGSINGDFATIDLSSASDSVGIVLVKNAFAHTGVLPALLCSRTPRATLPKGEVLELASYGPMGNALTFPIETYVFCACCELAIQSTGGKSDESRFVVYGDDIVIETEYVGALLDILENLGFQVNSDKTFTSRKNLFRESCGSEWLQGEDVLPVRISRGFKTLSFGRRNPGLYDGVIELANSLFRFPLTRRFVIDKLFCSVSSSAVPFSSDGEIGLFSTTSTNFQLEWFEKPANDLHDPIWWHGLQRPVAKIWTKQGDRSKEIDRISDADHYFAWYCSLMRQTPQMRNRTDEDLPWRPWVPMTPTLLCRKHTSALYPTSV